MKYINSMGAGGAFFFTCYDQRDDQAAYEETLIGCGSDDDLTTQPGNATRCGYNKDKDGNLLETTPAELQERAGEKIGRVDISGYSDAGE